MYGPRRFWESLSPATRLAAAYVVIIMLVSLLFSASIYRLSAGQLEDSLQRQYSRFNQYSIDGYVPQLTPLQLQEELERGRKRLQVELMYYNLVILILSSVASYWLAKRTLQPIEEALDAQSRFTADASHELRTPLTAMQTEIEVALRSGKLTKQEAQGLLTSNLEEVAKLRALAEGLLRLARNDGHDELKKISLDAAIDEAMNRVVTLAQAKKIGIDTSLPKMYVRADEATLGELFIILLDNAIKYSQPKSTVKISAKKQGWWAVVQIKDEGQGIKASDLPLIFNRFFRADSSRSKQRTSGYGLGLSIAKQIVDLHRGEISVQSEPGSGTTFTIKLPLHQIKRRIGKS